MTSQKPRIRLFLIMVMFFWMSIYTYQPQLSVYAGLLGASSAFTGTILSAYGFTQMCLRVPVGLLSDRLRKRKFFAILGGACTVASAFGMYLAPSPVWLLIFRGVAGMAASMWVTITVLYTSYFNDGDSAKAMPRLTMFNNIGQLCGMLAGGVVSQIFTSRASFLLAGFIGLVAMTLGFRIVENVPETPGTISGKELLSIVKNKTLLAVSCLALLGQSIHQGASYGFNPKFASSELGASSLQLSFLSACMAAGNMTGAWLVTHYFYNKIGKRRCILTGPLLYGIGTILLPIVSKNIPTILCMQFIIGMGNGFNYPLLMGTAIAEIEQKRRGVAMGMFQSIYALGMFIGPIIMGLLVDHLSMGRTISVMGCLGLIEFTIAYFVIAREK